MTLEMAMRDMSHFAAKTLRGFVRALGSVTKSLSIFALNSPVNAVALRRRPLVYQANKSNVSWPVFAWKVIFFYRAPLRGEVRALLTQGPETWFAFNTSDAARTHVTRSAATSVLDVDFGASFLLPYAAATFKYVLFFVRPACLLKNLRLEPPR